MRRFVSIWVVLLVGSCGGRAALELPDQGSPGDAGLPDAPRVGYGPGYGGSGAYPWNDPTGGAAGSGASAATGGTSSGGVDGGGGAPSGGSGGSGGAGAGCNAAFCPVPGTGSACCTPEGMCGVDYGAGCSASAPCEPWSCPVVGTGQPCCVNDRCGTDTGQGCQVPPCSVQSCPVRAGQTACCTSDEHCGESVPGASCTAIKCVASWCPANASPLPSCCLPDGSGCGVATPSSGGCSKLDGCFSGSPCLQCVCRSCLDQLIKCGDYVGCVNLVQCMLATGCRSGLQCGAPGYCPNEIAAVGGQFADGVDVALALAQCTDQRGCICP